MTDLHLNTSINISIILPGGASIIDALLFVLIKKASGKKTGSFKYLSFKTLIYCGFCRLSVNKIAIDVSSCETAW